MHCDTALKLVDQVYDAALDPVALSAMLVKISEAVGCVQECLYAETPGRDACSVIAPRRDPAFTADFYNYWAEDKLSWQALRTALLDMPASATGDIRRMIEPNAIGCSDFFRSWWQGQKLGWACAIVRFPTWYGSWGFYGIHKPLSNDEFDSVELALFQIVAPHLVRAVSIQDKLTSLALEEELTLVDPNGTKAVILADAAGRVLFANNSAEALLSSGNGIKVAAGLLTPSNPNSAAMLRRLLVSCDNPGLAKDSRGGSMALYRDYASAPMTVDVVPLGAQTTYRHFSFLGFFQPTALLVITDPEQERDAQKRDLEERFGLTPAEATFALEIVKGGGRAAAAGRLGISVSTGRMHLTRIFNKLGVNRQAELVRLLSMLHCDCRQPAVITADDPA